MELAPSFPVVLVGLGLATLLVIYRASSKRSLLPPGPKPLPFIGNVHQLPKEREWLVYAKWAEEYGKSSDWYSW